MVGEEWIEERLGDDRWLGRCRVGWLYQRDLQVRVHYNGK